VFEFIAGRTLEGHLREFGAVTLEQAKQWFSQLASALQHAHGLGIVHRDVKPANIIVREPDGSCCLVDFGIALTADEAERLTKEGYVIGTPGYMSPEQMRGDDVDHATDIYSLSVCLYEALSGTRMQPGQYLRLSSINESIPVAIDELIEECLTDRDQRLDDLDFFIRRLNEALRPKVALSSVLSEGRLADLQAALTEMTPEEFRDRPAGQRALIVARVADLAKSGDPRLEMPIVHHLNLLVHLGARLNPDEYREVIQIALDWGFTHTYQNGDIGKSNLRVTLAREASLFFAPVHRMVAAEVLEFFDRVSLSELDEWQLNGVRQVVSNLLANRACDDELVPPLVALRRRVDDLYREM
jgi:serine/threonine protein kinase